MPATLHENTGIQIHMRFNTAPAPRLAGHTTDGHTTAALFDPTALHREALQRRAGASEEVPLTIQRRDSASSPRPRLYGCSGDAGFAFDARFPARRTNAALFAPPVK